MASIKNILIMVLFNFFQYKYTFNFFCRHINNYFKRCWDKEYLIARFQHISHEESQTRFLSAKGYFIGFLHHF